MTFTENPVCDLSWWSSNLFFKVDKMSNVNEKVFAEAVEIAHKNFWLADCPTIAETAKGIINKRERFGELPARVIGVENDWQTLYGRMLAHYVGIICKCCHIEELKLKLEREDHN